MSNSRTKELPIYRLDLTTAEEFVTFWSAQYKDPLETLYLENIGRPLTPERILALYTWKNGGKLSANKLKAVRKNFIKWIEEVQRLSEKTTGKAFLDRFSIGGAIWRIFWLHCWQPEHFPIYDQHVHRAMTFIKKIEEQDAHELNDVRDGQKVSLYLNRFLPFCERFAGLSPREVDRALWTFGKFLRDWRLPRESMGD